MLKDSDPGIKTDDEVTAWYEGTTICSQCSAGQLMQWTREKSSFGPENKPQHAVTLELHWVAVHCDYFKRRIERPDLLTFCGALRYPNKST